MVRYGVRVGVGIVLAILIGCFPAKDPKDEKAQPKAAAKFYEGDVELTLFNHTKADMTSVEIRQGLYERAELIAAYEGAPRKLGERVPVNGQTKFSVKAGKYRLSAEGPAPSPKEASPRHLFNYEIDVQGPTQLVVYDDLKPPTDVAAPAGVKQILELSSTESVKRWSADRDAKNNASREKELGICKKNIPQGNDKPAPGKTKVDGKWTCVMGGEGTGTNYPTVILKGDGGITATLGPGSVDRDTTWTGVMVGDELRFRYSGIEAGGRLKLDSGGRAMSGNGWTFLAEGRCMSWNMTCTK